MKKLLLSICLLLFANVLLAQTTFTREGFDYEILNQNDVQVNGYTPGSTQVVIPETVTYNGHTYKVTAIKAHAFWYKGSITSVVIGNNVTTIGYRAFYYCSGMTSVVIGNSVANIGSEAFALCYALQDVTILAENAPTIGGSSAFGDDISLTVPFGATGYTYYWGLYNIYHSWSEINYKINAGKTEILDYPFEVTATRKIINEGVLRIEQGGELIGDVSGIVEVETPDLATSKWHIIGAPFTNSSANYKLETLIPGTLDPTCLLFDYSANDWSNTWARISDYVATGEGFYAFPWNNERLSFTNYGDGIYSPNARDEFNNGNYNYDYSATPAYQINTGDVTINRTLNGSDDEGRWLPLANPYTFKLNVAEFITANSDLIRGGVLYKLDGTSYEHIYSGDIKVTEGFFVNATSNNVQNMKFTPSQRFVPTAKASVEREFISLVMIDQEREIEVLFAQNEEAQEGYDRFDANKLFSPYEIAEPYFITNNIALVKEEVNTLPYYATMNVRSYENKEVKFKANYIPEGYAVSLIDGEETIDLLQGQEYTTTISAGENANRFKVLIKKSVGLGDVEELEVNITNDNRLVNITTSEKDLQIEVYNALGQRVFATKDFNFSLNNVSAGAYMIKAFNNKASKTQKIIIK